MITDYIFYVLYALVYLSMGIGMKYILNFQSSGTYSADEMIVKGNLAVGFRRSGAQLGLAIAMIGVLSGNSDPDIIKDFIHTIGYGVLSVGFMVTSLFITDKVLLPGVNNSEELKKGNLAVGLVEFGTLVMTGIVAYSSISGDDGGVGSALAYFVAGQATLVALVFVYEKIFKSMDLTVRIQSANTSAGIYLSGKVIAYGLILQSAIIGTNSEGFVDSAFTYFAVAISGMVLLYIFEILVDRFIVTASKVSDILENDEIVAALQLSMAKMGMALFLGMSIL